MALIIMGLLSHNYPLQQAGLTIGLLIIGIGLSILASFLFKPKTPQPLRDDRPTTATQRGAFVPLVLGTRRVGPVVAFVGDRKTTIESEDVGGKGGGGGTIERVIYHERGAHILCVGCACRLKGIYIDGKLIPGSDNLDLLNTPSGTTVDFGEEGAGRMYWGDDDQPTDPIFTSKLGIATRLPRFCYFFWDRKRLGELPRWGIMEYVIEVCATAQEADIAVALGGASAFLNDGSSSGLNPAYILWIILTGDYPYGLGMPTSALDYTMLADLAAKAEAEHIPMNILAQDGVEVLELVAAVMQDMGFVLPDCCGVLAPYVIRQITNPVPLLDNDVLVPPLDEIERLHSKLPSNALVYEYKDEQQNYRNGTIDVDDDTVIGIRNRRRTKKIAVPTITNRGVVSKVAARRQLEDLVPPLRVSAVGTRALRSAIPGQAFDLPGVGRVRLASIEPDFKTPEVTLDLVRDMFDTTPIAYTDPDLPLPPVTGALTDDLRWRAVEVPFKRMGTPPKITLALFRTRAHQGTVGGRLWAATDGLNYGFVDTQFFASVGGVLQQNWAPPATGAAVGARGLGSIFAAQPVFVVDQAHHTVVERGPIITVDPNGDIENFLNFNTNPNAWSTGRQVMVIGSELFYVRQFANVSGNDWQALGVMRSRADTFPRQKHNAGAEAFVADALGLLPMRSDTHFLPGGTPRLKNQPFDSGGAIPLEDLTAKQITLINTAANPMAIPWFAMGGDSGNGVKGARRDGQLYRGDPAGSQLPEDLIIEWAFPVRASNDGAAGEGPYGQPHQVPAAPEGAFEVRVWLDDFTGTYVLTRTFANLTTVDADGIMRVIYTRDQRVTDQTDLWPSDDPTRPWYLDLRQIINGVDGPLVILQTKDIDEDIVPASR